MTRIYCIDWMKSSWKKVRSIKGGNGKVETKPSKTKINEMMNKARDQTRISFTDDGEVRYNIISPKAIQTFEKELQGMLPQNELSPVQLQQLNDYLYNASKEWSPKYHPTKEQYASNLRHLISDEQANILGKVKPGAERLPKQYAALSDLEEFAFKNREFNPSRPMLFEGGVIPSTVRGVQGLGSMVGELPTGAKRTAKEALQTMIRNPSRTPESPEEKQRAVYRGLSPADQRVFYRTLERLRFDPNDMEAKQILQSYMSR